MNHIDKGTFISIKFLLYAKTYNDRRSILIYAHNILLLCVSFPSPANITKPWLDSGPIHEPWMDNTSCLWICLTLQYSHLHGSTDYCCHCQQEGAQT